jgi:nucleoid-associated protein EbfC
VELNIPPLAGLQDQITAALAAAEQYARDAPAREYTGTAADGMVTAVVSGARELRSIDIHLLARRRLDNVTLGEAVVAAVVAAEQQAADAQRALLAGIEVGGNRVVDFVDDPSSFVPNLEGLYP